MPSKRTAQAPIPEQNATQNPLGFVWVIVVLYLLFAAAYNHLTPFRSGQHATQLIDSKQLPVNPDEAAHVANAQVYKSGRIPVFQAGNPDFEAHQPPLYYLLISQAISNTGDEPAEGARWISIILGALGILAAFFAVRAIAPERPELAQATSAFVGLLPMNVSLNASISNDVLTNLIVILGIWQTARIVRNFSEMSEKTLVLNSSCLGVILALGILTKTSALVLFAMVVVAGCLAYSAKIVNIKKAAIFVVISCGLGLIIASPWLIRNTQIYGDPLAQHIFTNAFIGTTETTQAMTKMVGGAGAYWLLELRLTFESFWGVFDAMQLPMAQWIYGVILLVCLVSIVGLIRQRGTSHASLEQRVIWSGLGALVLVTLAGYLRFNMTFFQAQGRYLFPALVPIGLCFISGLSAFVKSSPNPNQSRPSNIVLVVTAGLAILNVYCIQYINFIFPPVQ